MTRRPSGFEIRVFVRQALLSAAFTAGTVGTSDASEPAELEEIVVSAQKREENIQDVPISITALTRDEIDGAGIKRIADVANLTPSLVVNETLDIFTSVTVRGIGRLGGDQNTFGMYLDGFEVTGGSRINLAGDLVDLERIEVLRGPQGTTFGRNVTAGAINMVSVAPAEEFSGEVAAGVSNYGGFEAKTAVNLPLAKDVAALRLSGFASHSDGFVKNTGSAGDLSDSDRYGFRAALHIQPTERLTWSPSVMYQKLDQGRSNYVTDGVLVGQLVTFRDIIDAGLGLVPPGSLPAGPEQYFPDQNDEIQTNTPASLELESVMAVSNLQYDFDTFSIVSVSGYIKNELNNIRDADNSDFDILSEGYSGDESEFWSTELRAQTLEPGRFNWTAGLYASASKDRGRYSVDTRSEAELLLNLPSVLTGLPFDIPLLPNNTRIVGNLTGGETESYAVFAEGDFEIVPRLHVALGARNNWDRVEEYIADAVNIETNAFGLLDIVSVPNDWQSSSFEELTWRGSVRYELGDSANVYGTVSKGYRSGGLQLNNPARSSYGPELVYNYEAGVKAFLFDRRVALNAAAFFMDWSDIQINTTNVSNNQSFTDNAGGAEAKGAELDIQVMPFDGLKLTAGVSYVDTMITTFVDSSGLDRSGTVLPAAPKWHLNLSGLYQKPLSDNVDGFVRATFIHNSEQLGGLIDGNTELQFLDGYDRVDFGFGLDAERWRLEAYVQNAFDEVYATSLLVNGYSFSGAELRTFPRHYGLRVSAKF